MVRNRSVALVVGLIFITLIGPIAWAQLTEKEQQTLWEANRIFVKVARMVKPSVVNIRTEKVVRIPYAPYPFFDDFFKQFFDWAPQLPREEQEFVQKSLGSGVIVSDDGYILTNNHVIKDADKIWVSLLDNRKFRAKVVGTDPETDVAVLKIKAKDLPAIKIGDSDKVQEGEWVLAIGNPFGLGFTITAGIVSAKARSLRGLTTYGDFIQTDAAINPGNSGGALVNLKGELIGINTAIYTKSGGYQGIGFAIPINLAKHVMNMIIEKGEVVRGYLGVEIQMVDADLAKKFGIEKPIGVLVSKVYKDSPAEKAELKVGDLIIKYDGKEVENPSHLQAMVISTEPGTKVKLEIVRGKKHRIIEVKVGKRPSEKELAARTERTSWLGITVQTLTPDLARKFGYDENLKGVIVIGVDPKGPAAEKGIQRGDVIREMNNREVSSIRDYRRILEKSNPKEGVLLWIQRGEHTFYVAIYPNE
ncbi:TPA: DegQ family serine endoprotease [Candidatus Poribacteria bacterium]|nr:DegQ family serine endoprotease [Candidatus Poribacteria bacterium]HEX29890.1 DegQ family serine endoprotease [Candidatus Poribacteria bacterium]